VEDGSRGLAQFRIEAVMEGVTAAQLNRVQTDDIMRLQWDGSLVGESLRTITRPKLNLLLPLVLLLVLVLLLLIYEHST